MSSTLPIMLRWVATAIVPFDSGWSKNRMWLNRRGGRKRLSEQAKTRRRMLCSELTRSLPDCRPKSYPLWVWIHAEIADLKIDVANSIDLVLDAVQQATGVNDQWFMLGGVTWGLSGAETLRVTIGQSVTAVDSRVCTACSRMLPLGEFPPRRGSKHGVGARCRECDRRIGRERRSR